MAVLAAGNRFASTFAATNTANASTSGTLNHMSNPRRSIDTTSTPPAEAISDRSTTSGCASE